MPSWLLTLIEAVCVAVLAAGVAMIYVPAALVLLGVLGILACERAYR